MLLITVLLGCSNTTKTVEKKEEKVPPEKQAQYLMIRGINYAERGDHKEAMSNFKESYSINPKNVITVRSIGLLYSKLGDLEMGEKFLKEALTIDDTDTVSLYNLGVMYYQSKNYSKAIDKFNHIKIEEITDEIRRAKAYTLYRLKQYEKSREEFQSIDFIKKTYDIEFYNIYLDVIRNTKERTNIYSTIYKIYEKNINNYQFVQLFTDYLQSIEAYDESIDALKKYGLTNKFTKEVLIDMCEIFFKMEKYDEVERHLSLIPKENNFDKDVLMIKLRYYESIGNIEEANKVERTLNKVKGNEADEKNKGENAI